MAVMYIKEGPACSAALWHTGHGISRQARQSCLGTFTDLVWSADGVVYRKEELGREKFSCRDRCMPAMWPMWDHVTVLSPAF